MNNLSLIRERQNKADRLHKAQLTATRNGNICAYDRSNFKKRQKKVKVQIHDS
tara:strand:+ start:327 stop:485 length:159 start_codon:yes stop_codon:yes gene_type:complete